MQWNEMMYSSSRTFWYIICPNRSYRCGDTAGQSMHKKIRGEGKKSTLRVFFQIWIRIRRALWQGAKPEVRRREKSSSPAREDGRSSGRRKGRSTARGRDAPRRRSPPPPNSELRRPRGVCVLQCSRLDLDLDPLSVDFFVPNPNFLCLLWHAVTLHP